MQGYCKVTLLVTAESHEEKGCGEKGKERAERLKKSKCYKLKGCKMLFTKAFCFCFVSLQQLQDCTSEK